MVYSKTYIGKPSNINIWEELVAKANNFYMSVLFDEIQKKYNNLPIYFICFDKEDEIVGGVKLYCYESRKLPVFRKLSRNCFLYSEPFILTDNMEYYEEIRNSLQEEVEKYITIFKPIKLISKTSFSTNQLKLKFHYQEQKIGMAYIDLERPFEEIFKSFSFSARRNIRTAIKKKIRFEITNNIDLALKIFDGSRSLKNFSIASSDYIKSYYQILSKKGMCDIWITYNGSDPISTAIVTKFGTYCIYEFGTTKRTNTGSGYFIQSEIIKYYSNVKFTRYYLGQVAIEEINNPKFEQGVTFFKMQFSPIVVTGFKHIYLFSPFKHFFWNALCKLMIKK